MKDKKSKSKKRKPALLDRIRRPNKRAPEKSEPESLAPGLALLAGGAGTARFSKLLSDVFRDAGLGPSPKLTPEADALISRFGHSLDGRVGDWANFAYNYAQTGSDAARSRLFEGRDISVADDIMGIKHDVGKTLAAKLKHGLEHPFGIPVGPNRLSKSVMPLADAFLRTGDKPVPPSPANFGGNTKAYAAALEKYTNDLKEFQKGVAHYKSFELGPRQAYNHMIQEGGFGIRLGELADTIIDARKNYANPANAAGRAFKTPEQFFSWKLREVVGPASARPVPSDYPTRAKFREALKGYKANGVAPVFSSLFENSKPFLTREDLIRELAAGKHPNGASLDALANTSVKGIMDYLTGESNDVMRWKEAPSGRGFRLEGKPNYVGFRNFADMRQNRKLIQHYVDPILGRNFRGAPGTYGSSLFAGKILTALARKPVRIAGGAAAAVGATSVASAIYKRIKRNREQGEKRGGFLSPSGNLKTRESSENKNTKNLTFKDVLALLAGGSSAVATSSYGRKFLPRDFNPFAPVHATVIGGTRPYDAFARDSLSDSLRLSGRLFKLMKSGDRSELKAFIDSLSAIKTRNPVLQDQLNLLAEAGNKFLSEGQVPKNIEQLLTRRIGNALRLDSFSAQTHATIDALRDAGVKIDKRILRATNYALSGGDKRIFDPKKSYLPLTLGPEKLRGSDMIVQIGDHPQEDLLRNERNIKGTKLYRVNTDFGSGNFRQPEMWLDGKNWMRVNDPKLYDRIVTPGLRHFERKGLMGADTLGRRGNLHVDNIAVSPVFSGTQFSENLATATGKGRVKAMYTFGGGAGGFLGLGEPFKSETFQYNLNKNRVLDDILGALRKKHGDNFDLDLYVGNALDDTAAVRRSDMRPTEIPHNRRLKRFLSKIENALMSDEERARRGLAPLTEKQKLLRQRFKNLRIVKGVPQSELARAYANSDYVFMVPGSTSAEFASMRPNAKGIRGKLISMIPDEELSGRLKPGQKNWMARHFSTNADYIRNLLGGNAESVSLASKTRADDILKAISCSSSPASGPKVKLHGPDGGWRKAIGVMKRDVRLGRLNRLGGLGLRSLPFILATGYGVDRIRKLIGDRNKG